MYDATLIFPRRKPDDDGESSARPSSKSAADGFTFSFVKVHSYRSNPGAPSLVPRVSGRIGPYWYHPPWIFFSFARIDSHKIKFTKRREFPCSYDREGRRAIDHPRPKIAYIPLEFYFVKTRLQKITLQLIKRDKFA